MRPILQFMEPHLIIGQGTPKSPFDTGKPTIKLVTNPSHDEKSKPGAAWLSGMILLVLCVLGWGRIYPQYFHLSAKLRSSNSHITPLFSNSGMWASFTLEKTFHSQGSG